MNPIPKQNSAAARKAAIHARFSVMKNRATIAEAVSAAAAKREDFFRAETER